MQVLPSARFLDALGLIAAQAASLAIRWNLKRTSAAAPARSSTPFLRELALGVKRDVWSAATVEWTLDDRLVVSRPTQ